MIWAFPARVSHLGLAVSGGGDSMAMLDLYRVAAADKGVAISAATVNHGLRPEAADEVALVARYCAKHGIPHQTLHWDGTQACGNLMAAARDARYGLLADWARQIGAEAVALAHTAEDQAETVLMALARASGVDGLAGMAARSDKHGMRFYRPLLKVARADLRAYLVAQGIAWADDPTNEDDGFERVRMRRALPMLADLGITVEALGTVAHAASMTASVVQNAVRAAAEQVVTFQAGDIVINRRASPPQHPELMRRIELAALGYIGQSTKPIRIHKLAQMDYGLMTAGTHTLAGCRVTGDAKSIRIARETGAIRDTADIGALWDGRWVIHGPKRPGLRVRALGESGLALCPDWRATGLARTSLMATPSVWKDDVLVSAPIAGMAQDYCAELTRDAAHFFSTLLSH